MKSIITKAGYRAGGYRYEPRIDRDGFLVIGAEPMSVPRLENAALQLKITVEIHSAPGSEIAAGPVDATAYKVTITMSADTVGKLLAGNYHLYGFKAVKTTQGGGAPLVWFSTQQFSATTVVDWTKQYQAYTSNTTQIADGTQITASFSADIDLGQTLQVQQGGIGPVVAGGPSIAISILNTTSGPFTCGISEMKDGAALPLCAFPLYGNQLDVIAPIEKVLLMFSTLPVNTGTVIEQAYSSGILIDLTGENQRKVEFDINAGWSWGGFSWGQAVAPTSNLIPLLIESGSVSLARRAAAMR